MKGKLFYIISCVVVLFSSLLLSGGVTTAPHNIIAHDSEEMAFESATPLLQGDMELFAAAGQLSSGSGTNNLTTNNFQNSTSRLAKDGFIWSNSTPNFGCVTVFSYNRNVSQISTCADPVRLMVLRI